MADKDFPVLDKVRTEDQERLDRKDFDAGVDLVEDALQIQMGALLGHGCGLVSPPTMTYLAAAPQKIQFGTFQYYLSSQYWTDDSVTFKGWKGAFHLFDPQAGNQAATVNISVAYNLAKTGVDVLGARPYIYVQPEQKSMDADARRKYVGGADQPAVMSTRYRVRHLFSVSTEGPDAVANQGKALIAHIISWSGEGTADPGTPAVRIFSFVDGEQEYDNTYDVGTDGTWETSPTRTSPLLGVLKGTPLANTGTDEVFRSSGASKGLGLIQLLHIMRSRMARIVDANRTSPWYHNAYATLSGTTYYKGLKQLISDVVSLNQQPVLTGAGRVQWTGAFYTPNPGNHNNIKDAQILAVGVVMLGLTSLPAGATWQGVCVAGLGGLPGSSVASVENGGFAVGDPTQVQINLYDINGVPVDGDFYVNVFHKRV